MTGGADRSLETGIQSMFLLHHTYLDLRLCLPAPTNCYWRVLVDLRIELCSVMMRHNARYLLNYCFVEENLAVVKLDEIRLLRQGEVLVVN